MITRVPEELNDRSGHRMTVHRAWPRDGGRLIFEASETAGGRIRAGSIDATGGVRIAPYGEDPVLTGLTSATYSGKLLVHRYKRRAVIRHGALFTKLLPPGKSAKVAASHRLVSALAARTGLVVPDVVAQESGGVTISAVPGISLHELGSAVQTLPDRRSQSQEDWLSAWTLFSLRWPLFAASARDSGLSNGGRSTHESLLTDGAGSAHEGLSAPGPGLAEYSARDECATLALWVTRATAFGVLPGSADRLQRMAAQAAAQLLAREDERRVLSHRDLHDKQLIYNAEMRSIGLIDCDTLALAEPALDLANLLAHIGFRQAQGVFTPAAAAVAAKAVRATADAMDVPQSRLDAYAASTRLRLACIYAFRPPYRRIAGEWLAEQALVGSM